MKFIHLSDICIGNNAESGLGWEGKRLSEIEESLRNILRTAEDKGAELLLITGGLFSHIPVEAELSAAADIFRAHPGMDIAVTAGETDPVTPSSPVRSFDWPANVHYVLSGDIERIDLVHLGTEIFAASVTGFKDAACGSGADRAASFAEEAGRFPDSEPIRIAMLQYSDDDGIARAFSSSGFSYVAVGGSAKRKDIIEGLAYAPGRLEPFDASDTGVHGAMSGEISRDTGRLLKTEFLPIASMSYITLNVRMTSRVSAAELMDSVIREIEKRGGNNIYRLRLTGSRDPGESLELSAVRERYRIAEIIDETEPEYDYARLFREHPQDMIGFYISSIAANRDRMSETERKAMFYGIDALISTSEKEAGL